jgi:nucleoside-triphosphatase
MPQNVLIIGAPGIGKTSLISHLHRDLTPLVIRGFYKEPVHENKLLRGYRISSFDFRELILAHSHIVGPDRFGAFGLNLDGFEKFVSRQLVVGKEVELFLIDEIGTMECLSALFRQKILEVMDSDIPLIATLASMDVLKTLQIKKRKDISLLQMTLKNRESLWKEVLVELSKPHP